MDLFQTYMTVMNHIQSNQVDEALGYFAEDVELHTAAGALPPLQGKQQVEAWLRSSEHQNHKLTVFKQVSSDNTLFVEGVDEFDHPDGAHLVLPYAGVFEFSDGLITGWRDYLDTGLFARALAGKEVKDHVTQLVSRPAIN